MASIGASLAQHWGQCVFKPLVARVETVLADDALRMAAANADCFESPLKTVRAKFRVLTQQGDSGPLSAKKAVKTLRQCEVIVLGDLYGNPRKLLDTLIASGRVSMSAEKAQAFHAALDDLEKLLAQKSEVARHEAKRRLKEIEALIANDMKWADSSRQLILAGDTIADKAAMADRVIVSLCRKFRENIQVVASNHDYDALTLLAEGPFTAKAALAGAGSHKTSLVSSLQSTDKRERPRWMRRYADYLLRQRLLIAPSQGARDYALVTHAPVGRDHFRDLTRFLRAGGYWQGRYRELTPETLPAFEQAANSLYQDFVRYRLNRLLPAEARLAPERAAFFAGEAPRAFLDKCRTLNSQDKAASMGEAFSRFLTNHGKSGFLTLRASNVDKNAAPLAGGSVKTHVYGHVHEKPQAIGETTCGTITRTCLDNGSGLKEKREILLWAAR